MITRIIIGIIGVGLGFIIVWKNIYIVDHLTGRNAWAERTFGGAGTYTFIKLIGVLVMFLSLFYMSGMLQTMILKIFGFFFSGLK